MFGRLWFQEMREAVSVSLYGVVIVVAGVLLPCSVKSEPSSWKQNTVQLVVSREVDKVAGPEGVHGEPFLFALGDVAVQFHQCVRERGREFCFGLLDEQFAGGRSGNSGAQPRSTKSADDGADNTDPSCNDRVSHVLWAQAGGTMIVLVMLAIACVVVALREK